MNLCTIPDIRPPHLMNPRFGLPAKFSPALSLGFI